METECVTIKCNIQLEYANMCKKKVQQWIKYTKNNRKAKNVLKMLKMQNKNCSIKFYISWIKCL